jgi:signal transduction histidine kinase
VQCPRPILIHDPAAASHVFYILKEAVTNAVKHAKPSHVVIACDETQDRLIFTVRSDGLPLPRKLPTGGMGMGTMRHRAEVIGASLEVARGRGGTAVVACSLPKRLAGRPLPTGAYVPRAPAPQRDDAHPGVTAVGTFSRDPQGSA